MKLSDNNRNLFTYLLLGTSLKKSENIEVVGKKRQGSFIKIKLNKEKRIKEKNLFLFWRSQEDCDIMQLCSYMTYQTNGFFFSLLGKKKRVLYNF